MVASGKMRPEEVRALCVLPTLAPAKPPSVSYGEMESCYLYSALMCLVQMGEISSLENLEKAGFLDFPCRVGDPMGFVVFDMAVRYGTFTPSGLKHEPAPETLEFISTYFLRHWDGLAPLIMPDSYLVALTSPALCSTYAGRVVMAKVVNLASAEGKIKYRDIVKVASSANGPFARFVANSIPFWKNYLKADLTPRNCLKLSVELGSPAALTALCSSQKMSLDGICHQLDRIWRRRTDRYANYSQTHPSAHIRARKQWPEGYKIAVALLKRTPASFFAGTEGANSAAIICRTDVTPHAPRGGELLRELRKKVDLSSSLYRNAAEKIRPVQEPQRGRYEAWLREVWG